MEYQHAVFIGRFQPFHNGHLQAVKHGLEIAENVIIVIGSSAAAPSIKNPFTFDERRSMIVDSLGDDAKRVKVFGVRDYYYRENAWLADVQAKTEMAIRDGDSVALLGAFKDASSYYLRSFPQWEYQSVRTLDIDSTTIRKMLLGSVPPVDWEGKPTSVPYLDWMNDLLPKPVRIFLTEWVKTSLCGSLCREWKYIADYKDKWKDAPFPPTFVTADAVVVCSGHVLVVKRKFAPGKGLYAIPGGFIKQNETVRNAAIRELREETAIKVDKLILESNIVSSHVFDDPRRSERGRTITHGFHIALKDGRLPAVSAKDDAEQAFWMPLWDVISLENRFFEDHAHIIGYFTNVGTQEAC